MPHADHARYMREVWYPKNRAKHQGLVRSSEAARLAARYEMIDRLKAEPCTVCGNRFDPVCMDFDHRPGETKEGDVATMVSSASTDRLLAEIAKCDLVCANCHRLRTAGRRPRSRRIIDQGLRPTAATATVDPDHCGVEQPGSSSGS